jgi:hypothetical protein
LISRARPDTVFLIPDAAPDGAPPLLRSDDAGLSWRSAVPDAASWTVVAVADAPDGRFMALLADCGLVTFD